MLADRCATPDQLTTPTEPLSLGYKRHTITLLMNGQVATITENDCICVFAISVVADSALGVLLFALASWLTIDRSSTT